MLEKKNLTHIFSHVYTPFLHYTFKIRKKLNSLHSNEQQVLGYRITSYFNIYKNKYREIVWK